MHCLALNDHTDICVTVKVKLINKGKATDDLVEALREKDRLLKAQHLASKHEKDIAVEIKRSLEKDGPS